MTTVDDACILIDQHLASVAATACGLDHAAGRILREAIFSDRDQPPFDRVTMDGIAIAFEAWASGRRRFKSSGVQSAGRTALTALTPDACIDVMTGSMLPEGTDTVIPIERVQSEGAERKVHPDAEVENAQFVHPRGSDRLAGTRLLEPGDVIGPPEIAVLASAGRAQLKVAPRLQIAVISTGDELVAVDRTPLPYQIRSTNDRSIECSLVRRGLADCERIWLRDEPAVMEATLESLHAAKDALILTGGVSMGQFDFVPTVLAKLGVRNVFHRIEQRPGRPMWFGVGATGKPVFALPGNPVSTLVCLTRYVLPALRHMLGARPDDPEWVMLRREVTRSPTLTYFVPVRVATRADAVLEADPQITNTSGDFMSLIGTDGFVELAPGAEPWLAGHAARLFRW